MNIYELSLGDFLSLVRQFPEALKKVQVTINPPKKVLGIGVSPPYPSHIYAIDAIKALRINKRISFTAAKALFETGGYEVDVDSDLYKALCSYGVQFEMLNL